MAQPSPLLPSPPPIGGRLTAARKAVKLSRLAVARALGIDKNTIKNWETDTTEPRIGDLVRLATLYAVPPVDLFA